MYRTRFVNRGTGRRERADRQIEKTVVKKLKQQAGAHGVSMEEEHRRILRKSLFGKVGEQTSFKEALLTMPNVGKDTDFKRDPQLERPNQR